MRPAAFGATPSRSDIPFDCNQQAHYLHPPQLPMESLLLVPDDNSRETDVTLLNQ